MVRIERESEKSSENLALSRNREAFGPSRIAEARSAEEIRRGLRVAGSRSSCGPERTNREPVEFPGSSLRRAITDATVTTAQQVPRALVTSSTMPMSTPSAAHPPLNGSAAGIASPPH